MDGCQNSTLRSASAENLRRPYPRRVNVIRFTRSNTRRPTIKNEFAASLALGQQILAQLAKSSAAQRAQRRRKPEQRVAVLRRALEGTAPVSDRLSTVRELLVSERNKPQQVVVWVHACILETNSAGLSILVDRFNRKEIARIDRALDTIGATVTRKALAQILARVERGLASGKTWTDASDAAHQRSPSIARKSGQYVTEMERCLLTYCQDHVEKLAAG
jgi:hypothetical protein